MIAGLEGVSSGTIRIGDREVTELAPRSRDVAMVFQNYALYPHMRVWDNLAFALKLRRTPKAGDARAGRLRRRRAGAAASSIDRKPGALSGGQRQRVAIGRAMVREPQAYLMDEPLSNLDAKLRVGMRAELARLHDRLGVTTVYVTHDQVEAMTLGDRVAVLRDGTIQQCDTPERLFEAPANVFVAAFMGSPAMNLVPARGERRPAAAGRHRAPARRYAPRGRRDRRRAADGPQAGRARTATRACRGCARRARGGRAARRREPRDLPRRRADSWPARRRPPPTRRPRRATRRCWPPTTARASPRGSRGAADSRRARWSSSRSTPRRCTCSTRRRGARSAERGIDRCAAHSSPAPPRASVPEQV